MRGNVTPKASFNCVAAVFVKASSSCRKSSGPFFPDGIIAPRMVASCSFWNAHISVLAAPVSPILSITVLDKVRKLPNTSENWSMSLSTNWYGEDACMPSMKVVSFLLLSNSIWSHDLRHDCSIPFQAASVSVAPSACDRETMSADASAVPAISLYASCVRSSNGSSSAYWSDRTALARAFLSEPDETFLSASTTSPSCCSGFSFNSCSRSSPSCDMASPASPPVPPATTSTATSPIRAFTSRIAIPISSAVKPKRSPIAIHNDIASVDRPTESERMSSSLAASPVAII